MARLPVDISDLVVEVRTIVMNLAFYMGVLSGRSRRSPSPEYRQVRRLFILQNVLPVLAFSYISSLGLEGPDRTISKTIISLPPNCTNSEGFSQNLPNPDLSFRIPDGDACDSSTRK